MATPLTVKVFQGDALVSTQLFERDVIKIGRLASAHVCLSDARVARIHSVLEVADDGTMHVVDMGSMEGTHVNGQRVTKGRVALGDSIRVGATTLKLEAPSQKEPAATLTAAAAAEPIVPTVFTPLVREPALETRARPLLKTGPLGLAVRFVWGRHRVGELFLQPDGRRTLSVGTASGVDFVLDAPELGSERFELIATRDRRFHVRFTAATRGVLHRPEGDVALEGCVAGRAVAIDERVFELTLGADERLTLELGGLQLVLSPEKVPTPVCVSWQESVDFAAVNIFLVVFFLATLFVVSATHRAARNPDWQEDIASNTPLLKERIKQASRVKPVWEDRSARVREPAVESGTATAAGETGRRDAKVPHSRSKPNPQPGGVKNPVLDAKAMARNMAGAVGLKGLLDHGGLTDVMRSMGDVRGDALADKSGVGGMRLYGDKTSGGIGNHATVGIDGIGTRYSGPRGALRERETAGILGNHRPSELPPIESEVEIHGMDPELIRKVIRDHKDQVRYCYETELMRKPNLAGKVKVRFVISPTGSVAESQVSEDSSGSPALGTCIAGRVKTWLFPMPQRGGIAVVSYPFLFKRSGD